MFISVKFIIVIKKILVEPYWNLNLLKLAFFGRIGVILVEPYWNLNSQVDIVNEVYSKILVEPYWNLNTKFIILTNSLIFNISRTILEFKLLRL